MENLTAIQRDMLYVIVGLQGEDGDGDEKGDLPHGLAIQDALEASYDSTVDYGQLYPNLDALVENGLVIKGKKDRRTNWYELTDCGERTLIERREWEATYLDLHINSGSDSDLDRDAADTDSIDG